MAVCSPYGLVASRFGETSLEHQQCTQAWMRMPVESCRVVLTWQNASERLVSARRETRHVTLSASRRRHLAVSRASISTEEAGIPVVDEKEKAVEEEGKGEGEGGEEAGGDVGARNLPKVSAEEHVSVLKRAALTRKGDPKKIFSALYALEKMKLDPSKFLETIAGTHSPGRTWMLIFSTSADDVRRAQKGGEGGGSFFPISAIQRFDAQAMEIENGVYLGPLGNLSFKGPMNWIGRRLPFLFHTLSLTLGSLQPFKFNIGKKEDGDRKPGEGKQGAKDPFFTWFYADEEIIAARGRGGGVAFWVRCTNVKSSMNL